MAHSILDGRSKFSLFDNPYSWFILEFIRKILFFFRFSNQVKRIKKLTSHYTIIQHYTHSVSDSVPPLQYMMSIFFPIPTQNVSVFRDRFRNNGNFYLLLQFRILLKTSSALNLILVLLQAEKPPEFKCIDDRNHRKLLA